MAWSGSETEFQGFIDEHGLTFPTIADDEAVIYERFGIPVQPALVVIDTAGGLDTIHGSVDEALLDEVFTAATQP